MPGITAAFRSTPDIQEQMRSGCIYEQTVAKRKKQPGTDEETNGEQPALEPFPLVREALGAKEVAFKETGSTSYYYDLNIKM